MTAEFLQVITTTDSEAGARALARSVVGQRLAACAQVSGPVSSVYWWQGNLEEATEWTIVFKTLGAHWPALRDFVKAHHSYTVPEILAVPVSEGDADYLSWLREHATGGPL
jgi:periplasmic divalent cation tolerance protein